MRNCSSIEERRQLDSDFFYSDYTFSLSKHLKISHPNDMISWHRRQVGKWAGPNCEELRQNIYAINSKRNMIDRRQYMMDMNDF